MSRGVGIAQRLALAALRQAETQYGEGWFTVATLVRFICKVSGPPDQPSWPSAQPEVRPRQGGRPRERPPGRLERIINPSRILASLERRGAVQRFRGLVVLTEDGRRLAGSVAVER